MKVKEEEADTKREVNGGGKTEQSHGGADGPEEAGRLVMTIHGRQKQLPFGPDDLLSAATMLTGDKVSSLDAVERAHRPALLRTDVTVSRCASTWRPIGRPKKNGPL